jgi:methionyl-tRNA formyltransferase
MTELSGKGQYNSLLLACSGLLGAKALKYLYNKEKIIAVLTDKNSPEIINLCSKKNVPCFVGNIRNNRGLAFVERYKNSILFSINYIFLFDERIIKLFKYKFNIHGSLLPKYRGRTPHIWAIINNEKKTGVSIHDITLECDAGDIFFQEEIPIKHSDTGASILKKYFFHYPRIIKGFLDSLRDQRITKRKQNESLMTYFDKRTPEDGRINWEWQRERIYNWVRALAHPYPGAFCFLENAKIIINQIVFSDFGFFSHITNGTIVASAKDGFTVKTPNGCIKVVDYVITGDIELSSGGILR